MELDIKTIIREAIQNSGHHPFLFVGSGMSKHEFRERHKDELKSKVSALKIAISEHLSDCKIPEGNEELKLLANITGTGVS